MQLLSRGRLPLNFHPEQLVSVGGTPSQGKRDGRFNDHSTEGPAGGWSCPSRFQPTHRGFQDQREDGGVMATNTCRR
jgi:hypothetical protein